jgi:hypothetical protein
MKVVYHGVPKDMVGHVLYPLSQLPAIAPEAYQFQKSKYVGRESVLGYRSLMPKVVRTDTHGDARLRILMRRWHVRRENAG